ncbi:hypothetical protein KR032_012276 [Drosophila birchii]|nr:hypothetical protein KR032_012276 [Drosophila birchii]
MHIFARSRYNARVNCWFCSGDSSVPYAERNSWTCPHCDQYNGFTKDGDYNRDMTSQRDCSQISKKSSSRGSSTICANSYYADVLGPTPSAMGSNGLCDNCNEAQRLKVEKLAQFEPKNEGRFDQELKVFSTQLEQQYRLCSSCERHVNGVLHEKKKMVLGSKFLNFVIKGAALLKQPYINRLATAQRQRKLQRYRHFMLVLTAVNILCLICRMPLATSEQFTNILGQPIGSALFYAYSHILALVRVLVSGVMGTVAEQRDVTAKVMLYLSTFGKLLLYSMGLSHQQAQQATFASCFISMYPYAMLALSFLHKINDGLKFTRFTVILLLWSAYAKDISALAPYIDGITLILLGSVITIGLLATNNSNLLRLTAAHDESADDSFHRLCADECISDEETLSMLSQQLSDCSNLSQGLRSSTVYQSTAPSIAQRRHVVVPPASSVLSLDSLHLSNQHQQHMWRGAGAASTVSPSTVFQQKQRQQEQHQHQQQQHQQQMMMQQWNRAPLASNGQRDYARSTQSLLMPSRLPSGLMNGRSTTGLSGDVNAWLAANQSMNQDLRTASVMRQHQDDVYEDKLQKLPQQLSRTSSQSSGFESHPRPESYPGPASAFSLRNYNCTVPVPAASDCQFLEQQQQQQQHHHNHQNHQQTIQPGDLLRKWIDDAARAPPHLH